ncbi:MAG: alpha-L-fucosidase [Planctomycetes bacterium]|nr:alpha-L-fucosidase [Planctomycetota bacterium]
MKISLKLLLLIVCLMLICGCSVSNSAVPSYLKGYESLYVNNPRAASIQWFKDAKLGLFVHYALASLCTDGKAEYVRMTEEKGYDAANKELYDKFDARKFNADEICDLAIAAKMKYVTFTIQHLGRMYMYDTKVSNFTSTNSLAKRDLMAEMARACQKKGLGLFLYVPPEIARTDDEHIEHNQTVLTELLTKYGPIAGIWFDGIGQYHNEPENYKRLSETYILVRSLQRQCLISFKEGATGEEDFISPEHFLFPTSTRWDTKERQKRWEIRRKRWEKKNRTRWEKYFRNKPAEINTVMQECNNRDGIGKPSGWINDESARHLTTDEVMYLYEKARSLGANMLLNIGPRGDGSIHPEDIKTLIEIGRRL